MKTQVIDGPEMSFNRFYATCQFYAAMFRHLSLLCFHLLPRLFILGTDFSHCKRCIYLYLSNALGQLKLNMIVFYIKHTVAWQVFIDTTGPSITYHVYWYFLETPSKLKDIYFWLCDNLDVNLALHRGLFHVQDDPSQRLWPNSHAYI